MQSDQQQKALVREQFTRTAQVFGDYALTHRVAEAERLARMVMASGTDRAVDLACGLDLTAAILNRARNSAASEGLDNVDFALGDAQALPFANDSLNIAVTSYSLHHVPDPARVIAEMARVLRPGGRIGAIDIFVPEDPEIAALNNRIERLRDASHTRTLARSEFDAMFAAHGLRVISTYVEEQSRPFDHWMLVAGSKPGDSAYIAARRLMEASMVADAAWFHPRFAPARGAGDERELLFTNAILFMAAGKI